MITHPEFPSQNLSVDDQEALARKGALLERTFTTPHTGKVSWERWLGNIRAVGAEHSVLATDLGQVDNPPVEDGLALLVDRLLDAGFGEDEVHTMAVVNTRRLAGVPVAMNRRLLVIGAHAADFVWRAGGAIAVATAGGGTARVIALSYGERGESGELWREAGQTVENVKRIRHDGGGSRGGGSRC